MHAHHQQISLAVNVWWLALALVAVVQYNTSRLPQLSW